VKVSNAKLKFVESLVMVPIRYRALELKNFDKLGNFNLICLP
jgi:hypothetical protein